LAARALVPAWGLLIAHALHEGAGRVARPPQSVVMAFDNCHRARELAGAPRIRRRDEPGRRPPDFTFFVSGFTFIADASRAVTKARIRPRLFRINFGDTGDDIRPAVDYVTLHRSGREIASHAVGTSTAPNGGRRLGQGVCAWGDIAGRAGPNNGLDGVKLDFAVRRGRLSRAYLAKGAGLYGACAATASTTTQAASAMQKPRPEKHRRSGASLGDAEGQG